jgi:hypothetical protein
VVHQGEVGLGRRVGRLAPQGLADVAGGFVRQARGLGDQAQMMQGIRMTRLQAEDLPVVHLGAREVAALV